MLGAKQAEENHHEEATVTRESRVGDILDQDISDNQCHDHQCPGLLGPHEEKGRFSEDVDPEGEEQEYPRHAKLGQRGIIGVRYELMIGLGKAPDRVDPVFLIDARIVFAGGMGRETGQTAAKGKIILQDILFHLKPRDDILDLQHMGEALDHPYTFYIL